MKNLRQNDVITIENQIFEKIKYHFWIPWQILYKIDYIKIFSRRFCVSYYDFSRPNICPKSANWIKSCAGFARIASGVMACIEHVMEL